MRRGSPHMVVTRWPLDERRIFGELQRFVSSLGFMEMPDTTTA